jgi:hypothetical protein
MSLSTSPEDTYPLPSSFAPTGPAMDRRHGRPHSYSSPSLHHQPDSVPHSSEAAAPPPHPPRTHSHSAVASHFLAQTNGIYGGQTWMDFLRESGVDLNVTQAPHPHQLHQARQAHAQRLAQAQLQPQMEGQLNTNRRLPPLPHENNSRDSRTAVLPRPHSSETSSSSADRKRRLTATESPMRRPEGRRTHEGSAGPSASASGSAADPIVLDSLPPPSEHAGQGTLDATSGGIRRASEFVLPPWQPDASVTHCFVCGNQFTFFYRKHHCRYVD